MELTEKLKIGRDCYANKLWRIQNLYKIRDKKKQLKNMKLNNIQNRIWNSISGMKPIRFYELKYRQGGVSTFFLLYWLDDTIFNLNTISAIQADKRESLGYLFEIIRVAHDSMPSAIQPQLDQDSKTNLSFKNTNSKIFVTLSLKATAAHNIHISEACYCKDEDVKNTIAAASPITNISIESTGNGVGNIGYELYQDAKKGNADFKHDFNPWFIQEEYFVPMNGIKSINYNHEEKRFIDKCLKNYDVSITPEQILFRRQVQGLLKWKCRQYYPEDDTDAFLTSGNKFFNSLKIHRLLMELKDWEKENQYPEVGEDYICFERPKKGTVYIAGCDTSEGSHDYSVLKIINLTDMREAFIYRARVSVSTFYKICDKWGRYYNNALMGVERNNHGHAVILGLDEGCNYPNIWKDEKNNRIKITSGKHSEQVYERAKYGWLTGSINKTIMLDALEYAIDGNEQDDENHFEPAFTILDKNLLEECLTFERTGVKLGALEGKFDDDIIATAICYQICLEQLKKLNPKGTNDGIIVSGERENDY